MNKTEVIEDYNIQYKKHAFSKSIKITLKDEKSILVTMPYLCPYKTAREFLIQQFSKIKTFNISRKIYNKNFKTKFDTLKIIESDKLETVTKKGIVYFYYPFDSDFSDNKIQKALKEAHLKALRLEAKGYLIQRLDFLAKKYGFNYQKVSLKNQKTRFGSCSFVNNINLNINLMKYDFDEIDYVLLHELCHTKIKNHSKAFWDELEKYCPDYKKLRKSLKSR